mgnify:CR=1 FL=1|tara:strand:+ start:288 stop:794 length:507 start_codon:yes stop_codon:yes gene_type:complete
MTYNENIESFAKNGYDDEPEREAFRTLFDTSKKLRTWLIDYFKLNHEDRPFKIIEDPLGEHAVDLGMIDRHGKIVGLIEVDVLNEWLDKWPSFYTTCHRLKRKTKYYIDNSHPYINVSFNTKHNNAIVTTREIESQYPPKSKYFKVKKMYEEVREVPLCETIKFGTWS